MEHRRRQITDVDVVKTMIRKSCHRRPSMESYKLDIQVQLSFRIEFLNLRYIFQELPEPNRACLVGVYAFLTWNNYVTWYTRHVPKDTSQVPVAFAIPGHVTYQTPTRHTLLGSGSS